MLFSISCLGLLLFYVEVYNYPSKAYAVSSFNARETIITTQSMLMAFIFSVLTGILFGIYPARKASLINPVEA
jgi:ABC-type antimicrobial peptide transport system permease subunit